MFSRLHAACVALCCTVAASVPVGLSEFRMSFSDGRSALSQNKRRRDVGQETKVHVHFLADSTDYDFELELLPSAFTSRATLALSGHGSVFASDFEPPAYGDRNAVFTLRSGKVEGTVFTAEGTISVAGENASSIHAESHLWNETVQRKCGVHADAVHSDDVTSQELSNHESGYRHKRAYDQWWGSGACYDNDDTTWAAKMGVAVGYNMWVEVGKTTEAVTEYITTVIQTTNIVVSNSARQEFEFSG